MQKIVNVLFGLRNVLHISYFYEMRITTKYSKSLKHSVRNKDITSKISLPKANELLYHISKYKWKIQIKIVMFFVQIYAIQLKVKTDHVPLQPCCYMAR